MPWQNTPEDRRRSNATYDTKWRKRRLECLRAARWRCQIRLEGCKGNATQVDHILGAANDPDHKQLRAGCESCHGKITAQQAHDARWGNGSTVRDPAPHPRTAW
jgi:hypothetical protein